MEELICIVCPKGCHIKAENTNGEIACFGFGCPKGEEYAKAEFSHPVRVLTTTVIIKGETIYRLPVKTDKPIPKERIREAMEVINNVRVHAPVSIGDVIIPNLLDTGSNVVATRNILK